MSDATKSVSSKRQTTAYNRFVRVKNRIKEIHSSTVCFGLTHDEHLSVMESLFNSEDWLKLRDTDRAYIRGMQEILRDNWYRYDLAWMHLVDDEYVTPKYMDEQKISYDYIDVEKSQHIWKVTKRGFAWKITSEKVRM